MTRDVLPDQEQQVDKSSTSMEKKKISWEIGDKKRDRIGRKLS